MPNSILRVSVFANGAVLLDGNPVTLAGLEAAMDAGPKGETVVWYYREDAGGEAPPAALEVMRLITAQRLPVRLSTEPDFSDTVTPTVSPALLQAFANIRQRAAERQLVVVRADGRQLLLPAAAIPGVRSEAVAAVERLLPSSAPRNVAAIADTSWAMAEKPNLRDAGAAVPFFGLLIGFVSIGHSVWLFDASSPALLIAGCGEADLVLADSARLEKLPPNWQSLIAATRPPQILVFDRATSKLTRPPSHF